MISLTSDYEEGAHPRILHRLEAVNLVKQPGYGTDTITDSAAARIRAACACPEAEVRFLIGGTQTNAVVIGALLAPYEGVLAAGTGHVAVHEAGAIEAGGHKVLTLPGEAGKLSAASVEDFCHTFETDGNRDHMVHPGMVYLSQPTEYGTLYRLEELKSMRAVCDRHGLRLYVDGARLAYALACPANDVSLPDLARLTDAFYIGGTKCGALFGEAVVVPDPALIPHFFTIIKQRGALLAKGWLLGVQFDELFRDDLYLRIGAPALAAADLIRAALEKAGIPTAINSPTNQIFPILEDTRLSSLDRVVEGSFWEKPDPEHTVIRLATSWATPLSDAQTLADLL